MPKIECIKPAYQSPICLSYKQNIKIDQCIEICGKNNGAKYNCETHNFEVCDKIILKINSKRYYLDEYHFHIPAEHVINGCREESEVHYVFIELEADERYSKRETRHKHGRDVCGCPSSHSFDSNIMVIGRTIKCNNEYVDLSKLQVDVPCAYYEYDGTLTTPTYSPVRWIIGDDPICLNVKEICPIAKSARPIQDTDGRIILFGDDR